VPGRPHAVTAVRIGVFGGSFDPIHQGHLVVAAAAADHLGLDRVHFVPARAHPFKAGRHGANAEQRAAMVELAMAADPRFVLDRRELERLGPSYTVDTLRALRTECPADALFLLVGADAARELPGWHEAEVLPRLARIVALTRPGATPPPHPLCADTLAVPAVPVSATEIRERVRRGAGIDGLVPAAVAAYIEEHGLYRDESQEQSAKRTAQREERERKRDPRNGKRDA